MIASASGDQTVRLWDTMRRRALGEPLVGHVDWVNMLTFSPDGQQLYSVGRDGRLIAWMTSINQWQSMACRIANRNLSPAESQQYFQGQLRKTCEQ
jgi:WD40 repeat protein